MNRSDLRLLISAAFTTGRIDYARAICQAWLNLTPGDLGIRFELARAYAAENNTDDALKSLAAISIADLENVAAYQLTASLAPHQSQGPQAAASAFVLSGQPFPAALTQPTWMMPARHAIVALTGKHYDTAREQIDLALREDPSLPILSLILLKTHWQAQEIDLALPLAKGFHDRWPNTVAFSLCLIDGLFASGAGHQAVELLHTVSAQDAGADVVSRYWGVNHPYRDLWPQVQNFNLPSPIPADIITLLGLNRIGGSTQPASKMARSSASAKQVMPVAKPEAQSSAGTAKIRLENDIKAGRVPRTPILKNIDPLPEREGPPLYPTAKANISEELADIESALTTVASEIGTARANRKPVHVILFSPKLLTAKFGPTGAEQVVKLIGDLGKITAKRRKVTVLLLSPEAPADEHGLKAVDPTKAWDVKMQLHDLDQKLAIHNQAIGSLLLIGGDDLVPFHRLPNPTDDVDEDVPSDNPYGTTDENYFIPEWPVGRIPSPCGRDPEPLCNMLRTTIAAHASQGEANNWFVAFILRLLQRNASSGPINSMGYSASIWKDASLEVYAAIGKAAELQLCPPSDSEHAPSLDKAQLSYFNLHGVEDGPNWYGQRTQADGYGPLYPVALTPQNAGKAPLPRVIFTEACYGANVINKSEPDAALCLRFLTDGVRAFVGSTRIAYGSVAAPLIGADLLGRLFWENILSGLPVGESLRYAKLNLAHAMHKRQSFLDGEDQKTLIAFQLYGDPLLPIVSASASKNLFGKVKKAPPTVKTVAMEYATGEEADLLPETVIEIKALLAHYLPGSESAQISLSRPLSPIRAKSKTPPTHRVYTLSKSLHTNTTKTIPAFARVTVNKAGKVVKLAVSR